MTLRYATVCSGIEAPSVAWDGLGWLPVFFSEIEPFPAAVLAHHYPAVPNLGDLTSIDGAAWRGRVDLLVGGTPCQAFSPAGLRRSLQDERGNLTLRFVELCDAIEPALILWENVPGVLNTRDNAFGCFLAGLAGEDDPLVPPGGRWTDAGFVLGPKRTIAWRILDAQYFGLAQRRKRVFVVACPRNGADPRAILFESEGVRRDSPPSRGAWEGATGTAGARPSGSGGLIPFNTTQITSPGNVSAPRVGDPCHPLAARAHPPAIAFSAKASGPDAAEALSPTLRAGGHTSSHANAGIMPAICQTWALGSHAGAADGQQTNQSHASGGPVGSNIAEECAYSLRAGRTQSIAIANPAICRVIDFDNGTLNEISPTLRTAQATGNSGAGVLAFHPTQDPISSVEISHALGTGSRQGLATAAVCVTGEITHALDTANNGSHSSEDGSGRGVPLVSVPDALARCDTTGEGGRLDGESCTFIPGPASVRRLTPPRVRALAGLSRRLYADPLASKARGRLPRWPPLPLAR